MNHTLIPHPRFSLATPVTTAREIMLAALCAGLKAQVADQATKIAALEERNRQLTKALHRQACAGFVAMDYLVTAAPLIMLATAVPVIGWVGALYVIGSLVIGAGLMLYFARRICEYWDAHHTPIAPAGEHLPESDTDARIEYPAMGEAYADESFLCWEDEALARAVPTHPEALTKQLNEAIHGPAAEAARARFEATAQALQTA